MFDNNIRKTNSLAQLEALRLRILQNAEKIVELDAEISNLIDTIKSAHDYSMHLPEINHKTDKEEFRGELDSYLWRLSIDESGLLNLLSSDRAEKIREKYQYREGGYGYKNKEAIPVFSEKDAADVINSMYGSHAMLARSNVVDTFNRLNTACYRRMNSYKIEREYQSKNKIEKRMRFNNFPSFCNGRLSWSSGLDSECGLFGDLENCFRLLDGKVALKYEERISIRIKEQVTGHHNTEFPLKFECLYFKILVYKKGTVVLTFTNQKLLDEFNRQGTLGDKLGS
jgi:hypothetical protein